MWGRDRSRLAGAVLGLALSVAAPGAVARADQPAGRQTVELVGKRTVLTLADTPVVGTTFVAGGQLFDTSGGQAGEGFSTCAVTKLVAGLPPRVLAHCTSVFRLAGGELHLSSLRTYAPGRAGFARAAFAVVGGTGRYATARGDGVGEPDPAARDTYRFTFNLVTDPQ